MSTENAATHDELETIIDMVAALDKLSETSRGRVLSYLSSRYKGEGTTTLVTRSTPSRPAKAKPEKKRVQRKEIEEWVKKRKSKFSADDLTRIFGFSRTAALSWGRMLTEEGLLTRIEVGVFRPVPWEERRQTTIPDTN